MEPPHPTKDVNALELYFAKMLYIFKATAMWPILPKGASRGKRGLELVLFVTVMFLVTHNFVVCVLDLRLKDRSRANLIGYVKAVINMMVQFMGILQVLYFNMRGETLKQIHECVLKFHATSQKQSLQVVGMGNVNKNLWIFGFCFTMLCFVAIETPSVLTLVSVAAMNTTRYLPVESWYAFDVTISPIYQILFLLQSLGQGMVGLSFANLTVFCCVAMLLMYHQFKILNHDLRNLVSNALIASGVSPREVRKFDMNFNQYGNVRKIRDGAEMKCVRNASAYNANAGVQSEESFRREQEPFFAGRFDDAIHALFRDSAVHHQELFTCYERMEAFWSPLFLIQILFDIFFICLVLFVATMVREKTKVVYLLQYLSLDLVKFGIFGFFGTLLAEQSEAVGKAIYVHPWYMTSGRLKSSMQIMVIRAQRPVIFTAGKFCGITLITCREILRASFSYYTFMRNMGTEELY